MGACSYFKLLCSLVVFPWIFLFLAALHCYLCIGCSSRLFQTLWIGFSGKRFSPVGVGVRAPAWWATAVLPLMRTQQCSLQTSLLADINVGKDSKGVQRCPVAKAMGVCRDVGVFGDKGFWGPPDLFFSYWRSHVQGLLVPDMDYRYAHNGGGTGVWCEAPLEQPQIKVLKHEYLWSYWGSRIWGSSVINVWGTNILLSHS